MDNYFTLCSWIDSLPDDKWSEWKNDFYTRGIDYQNLIWKAINEAGVTTYEQFIEYMNT